MPFLPTLRQPPPPSGPSPQLPELLGEVYARVPPEAKTRILADLIRPLGLLSIVAVAGGVFAPIRLRDGVRELREVHVRLDDALQASPADVAALAAHVGQVSVETLDSLAQWLANNPVLVGSAAALLLLQGLRRRGRAHNVAPAP